MEMQCKMYVKLLCHHSQKAAKTAVQLYGKNNVFVMCVDNNKYVNPCNFEEKGASCPFKTAPYDDKEKVPQIYLKGDGDAEFIGGNDDFQRIANQLIANNKRKNTPPMNLLKL